MKNLIKKLQPFVSESNAIEIATDEDGSQIVDSVTKEEYGVVLLNDEGQFEGYESYSFYDEDEMEETLSDIPVNTNEIMRLSQLFVDTFIDREVQFSMLNEFTDNTYMVIYEERDPKLNIAIPHTGCTLHFTRNGELTSATIGQTDFVLEYPTIEISKEEAKERLRSAGYLQLAIDLPDEDEKNYGDAMLVYRTNDDLMSVSVDGKVESLYEFMDTEIKPVHRIAETTPTETIEEMLHVHAGLMKKLGEDDSEIWVDPTVPMEEEAIISIYNNEKGHFSYSNLPYENNEEDAKLSLGQLQERAEKFLELVVGNVHEKYVIEEPYDPSEDLTEFDEELFEEEIEQGESEDFEEEEWEELPDPEPTSMFTFYKEYQGIRLNGYEAHVHVGIYTGTIRECSVTNLTEKQLYNLSQLNLSPTLTMEEAEHRFFSEVEMTLSRSVKDLDDVTYYTLSYLVDFPKTGGHIEKINAHTGEVTYVDTGIIKEND
ncbi:PepSY domain-containing protein [Gracilibacillus massiliensis]|uniref:PepSY domain-containing protein n=1 Tax=Gracilibacillus massiliensis TaxID=1564956 RepID=UPI00071E5A43|nr:PepSY domain-containing protein [Gracilibacillus massiliensis]